MEYNRMKIHTIEFNIKSKASFSIIFLLPFIHAEYNLYS